MKRETKEIKNNFFNAITACIENAERLIADRYNLEFLKPPATRFYLILIAEEEFAKAFLLFLVMGGIIPWNRAILRAINNHSCKQLVGIVIDYLIDDWKDIEELEARIRRDIELGERLPSEVASALNILRHEKIRRWEADNWVWAEEPNYDPVYEGPRAFSIANRFVSGRGERQRWRLKI